MKSSSENSLPAMEDVSFRGAGMVLKLTAESAGYQETIRARYADWDGGFAATVRFLVELRLLEDSRGRLKTMPAAGRALANLQRSQAQFNRFLAERALQSAAEHGREITELLRLFDDTNGTPTLEAFTRDNELYAARNALVKADILRVDHAAELCEIPLQHHDLYLKARHAKGVSQSELEKKLLEQAKVGRAAELAVLDHERQIVGREFQHLVVDVATEDVEAGFDIASVRLDEGRIRQNLRIEVKAISPEDPAFFFTANEFETAQQNRDSYFLYLVPVNAGTPDIGALEAIQDPARALLDNASEWNVSRKTTLSCRKKVDNAREV